MDKLRNENNRLVEETKISSNIPGSFNVRFIDLILIIKTKKL